MTDDRFTDWDSNNMVWTKGGPKKDVAIFKVSSKGSAKSGNYKHKGRLGKVGGSAPNSSHATVRARFDNPADLPAYKQFGEQTEPGTEYHIQPKEDLYLKAILRDQGFDGKPDVVDKASMDAYIAAGEQEIWRGVNPGSHDNPADAAQAYAEQFKNGDLFAGRGVFGDGTYAGEKGEAADFATDLGGILRMTIKPDAKVIKYDDLIAQTRINKPAEWELDPGRWAAARGYDVIQVDLRHGPVYAPQWVILNRTAVRVDNHTYTVAELYPEEFKEAPVVQVHYKGSATSGNWGHRGRRGKVGGSAPTQAPYWGDPKDPMSPAIAENDLNAEQIARYRKLRPYDPPAVERGDRTANWGSRLITIGDDNYVGDPSTMRHEILHITARRNVDRFMRRVPDAGKTGVVSAHPSTVAGKYGNRQQAEEDYVDSAMEWIKGTRYSYDINKGWITAEQVASRMNYFDRLEHVKTGEALKETSIKFRYKGSAEGNSSIVVRVRKARA